MRRPPAPPACLRPRHRAGVRRQLPLILLMAALLTACGKQAPDGLATAGGIHPLSSPIGEVIEPEQLTDAGALLTSLQGIRDQAPPQDYSNENSMAARRSFYRERLLSLIPETASVLMPLGCVGADNSPLTFDQNSRNLVVQISSFNPTQAQAFREEVKRHLRKTEERLLEDQLYVTRTGRSMLRNAELGLPEDREKALRDFSMAAQIRRLPAGPRIAVLNNPISLWPFDLSSAVSDAEFEHLQFQIAMFARDQEPRPGSFSQIFRRADALWSRYPISEAMQPFFHKRIPYADPVEGLCLVGAFKGVDLRSGGELAIPMTAESDLVGNLEAWFIINRSNGRVMHRERAPQEKPRR